MECFLLSIPNKKNSKHISKSREEGEWMTLQQYQYIQTSSYSIYQILCNTLVYF